MVFIIEDGKAETLLLRITSTKLLNSLYAFVITYGWLAKIDDPKFTHRLTIRPGYDKQKVKEEIQSFVTKLLSV